MWSVLIYILPMWALNIISSNKPGCNFIRNCIINTKESNSMKYIYGCMISFIWIQLSHRIFYGVIIETFDINQNNIICFYCTRITLVRLHFFSVFGVCSNILNNICMNSITHKSVLINGALCGLFNGIDGTKKWIKWILLHQIQAYMYLTSETFNLKVWQGNNTRETGDRYCWRR